MKRIITGLLLAALLTSSCENNEIQVPPPFAGFRMEMNGRTVITPTDIDYYDFSTHLIYLKHDFSYFEEEELHDM
ncbi:MAG: hypothetical protein R6U19_02770, partial [Bacteroidales bacterium]